MKSDARFFPFGRDAIGHRLPEKQHEAGCHYLVNQWMQRDVSRHGAQVPPIEL